MRYIFKFPDIGEGVTEGKILSWYVDKGQTIQENQSIVKIETDKVVTDIPSPRSGVIVTRFGTIGEVIQVHSPLVEIAIEEQNTTEDRDNELGDGTGTSLNQSSDSPDTPNTQSVAENNFGVVGTLEVAGDSAFLPVSDESSEHESKKVKKRSKVLATPVARAMTKDLGVDINDIIGTGPVGRVTKKDIQNYVSSTHSETGSHIRVSHQGSFNRTTESAISSGGETSFDTLPLTQIRKTIAKNMMLSHQSLAPMSLFDEVEVSRLIEIRKRHKDTFAQKGIKLTYLAFITKIVGVCLQKHLLLNGKIDIENDRIIVPKKINISLAIDTEDGLVVPVIRDVPSLSIVEIARTIQSLSQKAHDRSLALDEMRHGTFTITNTGSFGGYSAVPIINYPQSAILGVGRIDKKPIVKDDAICIGNVMQLFLSVDHRLIDGGESTRFMNAVKSLLLDPVSLILFEGVS